jgi:O-antigen/teichoic acid export membrane protein
MTASRMSAPPAALFPAGDRIAGPPAEPSVPAAEGRERTPTGRLGRHAVAAPFVMAVAAVNVTSLLGNVLAFRWVDPAAMGVWHTLLLVLSYLGVVRLGIVNGMGRELPFALGRGDVDAGRRIAATTLLYNVVCSVLVGGTFIVMLGASWSSGASWRVALPAMAVVGASTMYLAYLQATFRSDRDFARLARVHWLQAGVGLLMPVTVYALGFAGLCLHAAAQSLAVTAYAHAVRPLPVRPRFELSVARGLAATGLPLFALSYLQAVALTFDRVILLQCGGVETVGHYAPAAAVLAAMAVAPGALSTWVYPRMSFALGRGESRARLRRMALRAAAAGVGVGLPVALAGWVAAPRVIAAYFPQYVASIPAVRWSLMAGLLLSVSPASPLLGSLKAWRSLTLYVAVLLVCRWSFPWLLSRVYEPLEGVARGNVLGAAVAAGLSLFLVWRATAPRAAEVAS